MAISFKSVGTKELVSPLEEAKSLSPIGFKTPLRLGSENTYDMHTDLFEQIKDNLRNLIMSNWGSRLNLFDFGANLKELSSEAIAEEEYDSEVAVRIKRAVDKWMPFVLLEELVPIAETNVPDAFSIRRYLVTYSVPTLSSPSQTLEISLGVM